MGEFECMKSRSTPRTLGVLKGHLWGNLVKGSPRESNLRPPDPNSTTLKTLSWRVHRNSSELCKTLPVNLLFSGEMFKKYFQDKCYMNIDIDLHLIT